MAKDMLGQRFERLEVIQRAENQADGRARWLCRCDCGEETVVSGRNLRTGITKSCGCLRREKKNVKDISGQVFGQLTVMSVTEKRDRAGSVMWLCRCSCGEEVEVSQGSLASGNKRSCGCLQIKNRQNIYSTLHREEGTCIEALQKRKRKDNRSGVIGVSLMSNGRYRAVIGFKGKSYHLGYFDKLEDAAIARENAKHIHTQYIQQFYARKASNE